MINDKKFENLYICPDKKVLKIIVTKIKFL